jgi:predicted MFS family arabinose efflux permease
MLESRTGEDQNMRRTNGLWCQPDFLRLWGGQTISELGSRITRDGLPLVALLVLGASPSQMGVIAALGSTVVLVISLPAGVWVDRLRRKPIMIAADLGRALLVASIPIAALTQQLRLEHLYVVVALNGGLTVLFNAAYEAYLPSLINRENLVEGNSKLALSSSMAEVLGPGLAGFLVQLLTAPIAMAADALSFLASIGSLMLIRQPEPPPTPIETRRHIAHEIIEGVRRVWGDRRLRALALAGGTRSFFGNFYAVLYSLYALRYLGLDAAALGVTIAMGGVGSLIGSALTDRAVRRFGLGRALIGSGVIGGALSFLIPLAGGPALIAMLILMVSQLGGDAFNTLNGITSISLRQSITPDRLLGRTSTSLQVMIAGVGPLGALLSGALAEAIGVRETLFVAAAGVLLSTYWLIASPIRHVRDHATAVESKV